MRMSLEKAYFINKFALNKKEYEQNNNGMSRKTMAKLMELVKTK